MTDEDFEKIMDEQEQYIEKLEAELAEYKHVASAIDKQWAESQDEIADLKAELAKMMKERDEAWKRAAHAEKMWGEAEVKLGNMRN